MLREQTKILPKIQLVFIYIRIVNKTRIVKVKSVQKCFKDSKISGALKVRQQIYAAFFINFCKIFLDISWFFRVTLRDFLAASFTMLYP